MADKPANLILGVLRAIRGDVADIKTELQELRERLGLVESQMAGHHVLHAALSTQLDQIVDNVQLIKHRLDLIDSQPREPA